MLKTLTCAAAAALPLLAQAQGGEAWQACTAIGDAQRRLACFDDWAKGQRPAPAASVPAPPAPSPSPAAAAPTPATPAAPEATTGQQAKTGLTEPPRRGLRLTDSDNCHEAVSELSRFWETEPGHDCGTFGIRGYRPISIAVATGNTVNEQPTSGNPANNATTATDYRTTEARLQLSLRTKVAQGIFSYGERGLDSLWLAYSQLSYWQLFTPALSRPFRNTDHEPEILYVTPIQTPQPGEWRWRVGGLGLVHQSNGQALPLSRSWNRVYVMAAAERDGLQVQGRLWNRLDEDPAKDDNPGISDYIGRGELLVRWHADRKNLFAFTARHGLKKDSHGSVRVEWFHALADSGFGLPSGLRLHTQLFSGYGDTLLDYNKARTMFSIGLSLVDW